MLMILARLGRSESFWAVVKGSVPAHRPGSMLHHTRVPVAVTLRPWVAEPASVLRIPSRHFVDARAAPTVPMVDSTCALHVRLFIRRVLFGSHTQRRRHLHAQEV